MNKINQGEYIYLNMGFGYIYMFFRIKYSDRLTALDFGPQAGGHACLGAHVF